MAAANGGYYIPHGTKWPIMGSIGLFTLLGGFALFLNGSESAKMLMIVGALIIAGMMTGWFATVIGESESGTYNAQVDLSFRHGMMWFIFSEVLFFAAFFGALFYSRIYSVPWLAGEGEGGFATGPWLWPGFEGVWPTNGPGDIGGAFETIPAFGIPFINTIILVSSGGTVTPRALGAQEERPDAAVLVAIRDGRPRSGVSRAAGIRVRARVRRSQPHSGFGCVWIHLLHADRVSRDARDDRRNHAARHADSIDEGSFHSGAPLRVRSGRVVLALRRRGLDRAVHLRLLDLTEIRPNRPPRPAICDRRTVARRSRAAGAASAGQGSDPVRLE